MKKISLFFFLLLLPLLASSAGEKKVHIVYFGEHKGDKALHEIEETHISYVSLVKENEQEARDSLLYSYKHSINALAAELTAEEAAKLSELEEVVSVYETKPGKYTTQTTRSWEFVGLEEEEDEEHDTNHRYGRERELPLKARYGKGVIIGVLDSGVWPESKSFNDEGMGPIPKSWKGICQTGDAFNSSHCSKKIIGARYFIKGYEQYYGKLNRTLDYLSPRDKDGHGTHTASTAAGRRVHDAAAFGGFARGTASGGAPLAHLAIYKACWAIPNQDKVYGNTCFEVDMLAAIDEAIADGVHILSMSIGSTKPIVYNDDGIAIGAFHAIKNNIVTVCAAGNNGPAPATLSNPAPWIITVSASSVDRAFLGDLVLGNGKNIVGQTATPSELNGMHSLVYAADVVGHGVPKNESNQCLPNSLDPEKVKGKIVMCMRGLGMRVAKGMEVKRAGGVGYILGNLPNNGNDLPVDAHVLPATAVGANNANKILEYIKSTKNPKAAISKARTVLHYKPAPYMAAFTSRGPNVVDPNVLKPDISAPGLNILAAWTPEDSPTKLSSDKRTVDYNIESGTSMACPHVAGAAALLKAIHPTWSSAAVRSAIMTTASLKNNKGEPITDPQGLVANSFQFGSGQFRPAKAADPGLIYDASYLDYAFYFCSFAYTGFTRVDNLTCPSPNKLEPTYNLNNPSVQITNLTGTVVVKRSVTNVGASKSVYFFTAKPPLGFEITASPNILYFSHVGQKKHFTLTIRARDPHEAKKYYKDEYAFGWFTWTDNYHNVRSPVALSLA